jgi:hypothetical protein
MGLENLKPVHIAASTTVAAPNNTHFKAITALAASVATVKGGIAAGLDANDSDGSSHLNASGSGTLSGTHAAGIYEMLPTVGLAITIPVGTTIYGRFTEISLSSGDEVIAYM